MYSIPDNCSLTNTANLPGKLKLCVGARIMLLDNIDIPGKLINGSINESTLIEESHF